MIRPPWCRADGTIDASHIPVLAKGENVLDCFAVDYDGVAERERDAIERIKRNRLRRLPE